MKKHLRRVWKTTQIGLSVAFFWIAGMSFLSMFFNDLLPYSIDEGYWMLIDLLFWIFLGVGMGLYFGVLFLLIPESKKESIKIIVRLVFVAVSLVIIPVFLLGFLEPYQQAHIDEFLVHEFSSPSWWFWGPIVYALFLIFLLGVFLFDRIQVWTPEFLQEKPEIVSITEGDR